MPRRALRCVVDLNLKKVSAPGVWLPSKEDIYLSVSVFNQYRNTHLVTSVFPLLFTESFRFEKTYYTAVDPGHVAELLEDELIIFELLQLSEYTDGAVRLATFSTNARDFLYPYPSLAPSYSSADREILMSRTIAFPGISPKLEFSTRSVIRESLSPEVDALEDAVEDVRLSRLRKARRTPSITRRSSSPSLRVKYEDTSLESTIDGRPPFVVRKLTDDLIGRNPGGPTAKHAKSKKKSSLLSRSPSCTSLSIYSDLDYPLKHEYRLKKVIREPYEDPLPVYASRYGTDDDDDDAEVAELTSSLRDIHVPRVRPRSVSPVLYTPSYRARFGDRSFSPSYSLSSRVDSILRRNRSLERLDRLSPVDTIPVYTRRYTYYDSLDDLELETKLARSRSLVHLDEGKYWTPNSAKLSGKTHRQVFTDTLSTIYGKLYNTARKQSPHKFT
ncbi:spermatogenesis-associated protein 6-like isoform X2 [Haliotis rufescens]|uniref:spermatogenesis-associated protein 6-like isoform X2 n=1 Tax=Haliotis rufescens TaxID=6454 RepID=UPI00201EA10C|nr:spermatogenesis-associated protein 6-like isoform X2 [Haliotis rufescens]